MNALRVYRDDGPVALALGRFLGRESGLPALLLCGVGVLPLGVAILTRGAKAGSITVAACILLLVVLGGLSSGRPHDPRTAWPIPALLRAAEYAAILWLAARSGAALGGAAYVLLAALAFHHYDLTYRLRHRGAVPPAWLGRLAGGWDGRVLVIWLLGGAGALPEALYVLGAVLGVVFVAESVRSWTRAARAADGVIYDEEDEAQ